MNNSILTAQQPGNHLLLAYSDETKRDDMIIEYINAGLECDQLCVIATSRNGNFFGKLYEKINDFEKNVANYNLILVDLNQYRLDAKERDTQRFDDFINYLKHKADLKQDKHIRFYGDLAAILFEEGDHDTCYALEEWCQNKSFFGSLVCPYNLNETTSEQKSKLLSLHDDVVYC